MNRGSENNRYMRNENKEVNEYLKKQRILPSDWENRGLLEAIRAPKNYINNRVGRVTHTGPIYMSNIAKDYRRRANARFVQPRLPGNRMSLSGTLLRNIPKIRKRLNYKRIEKETGYKPKVNMTNEEKGRVYRKIWAAHKLKENRNISSDVFAESYFQHRSNEFEKMEQLMKKPRRVALRITPAPKNPFTGRSNKVYTELYVRNGNKSFANLPRNIQTKILRKAKITITPNNYNKNEQWVKTKQGENGKVSKWIKKPIKK